MGIHKARKSQPATVSSRHRSFKGPNLAPAASARKLLRLQRAAKISAAATHTGAAAPGNFIALQKNTSPKKRAGLHYFRVHWLKNSTAGPTKPRIRLEYFAKFKKDRKHDPALADFRQSVKTTWKITDGPNKGQKLSTGRMKDDGYTRAKDRANNTRKDVLFYSNDFPGMAYSGLKKNDVIDYRFTAKQMIIDTSRNNKVIAKRGPHTAIIKGKAPRTYLGIPKRLI